MLGRVLLGCLLCFSLIGCKPPVNPGNWDQARVEEHLKKKHKLEEISLLPKAEGGFSGSGKTKLGETYMFKVSQNAEQKKLTWDFESDRGDTGSEILEIVKVE